MHRADCGLHFADLVNGQDVRMVERRGGSRFLAKALDALVVFGETRRQQLERDLTAQPRVLREIYFTHSSPSDLVNDLVSSDPLAYERSGLRLSQHCGRRLRSDDLNGI